MLDQLQLRVPGLSAGLLGAGVFRVRLGSRLRKRLVNWSVKRGFAAMNRSDVDVVVLFYEPDAEVRMRGMGGVVESGTITSAIKASASCTPTWMRRTANGATRSVRSSISLSGWPYAPTSSAVGEAAAQRPP